MTTIAPLTKEAASEGVHAVYDRLKQKFGKIPNIFALTAYRPDALATFLPFFGAVMQGGTIEARYKELAYLKASMVNGCEY